MTRLHLEGMQYTLARGEHSACLDSRATRMQLETQSEIVPGNRTVVLATAAASIAFAKEELTLRGPVGSPQLCE